MKAYRYVRARRTAAEVWKALRAYSVREMLDSYAMDASYEHLCCGGPMPLPRWRYILPALRSLAELRINGAICAAWGHKFVDAGSYAGPESAADNFICERCGEHFHHTYY